MQTSSAIQSSVAIAATRVTQLGGALSFRPARAALGAREAVVYADPDVPVCVWRHGPSESGSIVRSWRVGPWAIFALGSEEEAGDLEGRLAEHWPVLAPLLLQAGRHVESPA